MVHRCKDTKRGTRVKKRLNCEWTITPSEPPRYRHRCSKCKTMTSFYCGEKFRINGQKKTVDVWLISKCERCDSTFNVDIFSRVRPETIEKEEYDNFQCNDVDTSWRYAFRKDVIEQNKVDADFSRITYTMGGDILSLEQMCEAEEDLIEFEIKSLYDIDLKLTFVICENLNVSMKQLE